MKLWKPILALLFTTALLFGAAGALAADDSRVFDDAGLFTASEEAAIQSAITAFQQKTGMDFVVLTSDAYHAEDSQAQVADDYYDYNGFGFDDEKSGALYYIDMYNRQEYISTTGAMIDYMTDERIELALDQSNPNLRIGDYEQAVLAMIAAVQNFVSQGIPEGQYRYDVITGQRLTARHKVLTLTEMLVGAGISLLLGLIFIGIVKSRYKLKGSTYHYEYADNAVMTLTDSRDDYLRTTVTRAPKAPPPGSGGKGGFGGGGSGVHIGGSGSSHGGGGRGF